MDNKIMLDWGVCISAELMWIILEHKRLCAYCLVLWRQYLMYEISYCGHFFLFVLAALLQLEGGGTLLASVQALGCSCAIEKQPVPRSVSWMRRTVLAQVIKHTHTQYFLSALLYSRWSVIYTCQMWYFAVIALNKWDIHCEQRAVLCAQILV